MTSEFCSLTRGERDKILKSLSYHTMQTKLKRSAHLVEFYISFHLRWSGPEKLNCMSQRSKPKRLSTMVGTRLHGLSRLPTRPVPILQPTGPIPSKLPIRLANSWDPTRLAHRRDSTDVLFKIPKLSAHRFWACSHSHSYLGFIMTIVSVISSARERKQYPMSLHLN